MSAMMSLARDPNSELGLDQFRRSRPAHMNPEPDLTDAPQIEEDWRQDYNRNRPLSALAYRMPDKFRQELARRPLAAQEVAPR